jgi:hypothetical protein
MRHYQTLDTVTNDTETGIFSVHASASVVEAMIALRREGAYVAIAASYGPLEIALRPRHDALARTLSRLRPIGGLQTTRELGSTQAQLSVGLQPDGALVLRPTIVGDASGHIGLNFSLTDAARRQLYDWLAIPAS